MQFHFVEIARTTHAVLIVDPAVGHISQKLDVPENVIILRLPELNPVKILWQFICNRCLSNRVFRTCDNLIEIACHAWNRLVDQPWCIMSYRTGHMRHINQWLV